MLISANFTASVDNKTAQPLAEIRIEKRNGYLGGFKVTFIHFLRGLMSRRSTYLFGLLMSLHYQERTVWYSVLHKHPDISFNLP